MTRLLAGLAPAAAAVAVLAGCGGSSEAAPKEDPGQVMKSVVKHELSGDRDLSYAMLVREQRDAVPAALTSAARRGRRWRRPT